MSCALELVTVRRSHIPVLIFTLLFFLVIRSVGGVLYFLCCCIVICCTIPFFRCCLFVLWLSSYLRLEECDISLAVSHTCHVHCARDHLHLYLRMHVLCCVMHACMHGAIQLSCVLLFVLVRLFFLFAWS